MAARFEKISKYQDIDMPMPERKTAESAGYDIAAAEDIIIPPYETQVAKLRAHEMATDIQSSYNLEELSILTKVFNAKPTLIPTGMKCYLEEGTYLELSVRSSCPLKYWLVLANGVGIIDADYYNNTDNEGHIYFQVINLSPLPILIRKGEIIGQGIIKPYFVAEGDCAMGVRSGGFGSTTLEAGSGI